MLRLSQTVTEALAAATGPTLHHPAAMSHGIPSLPTLDVDEDAVSALRVTLGAATDTARWVGWWHQVDGPSTVSR